MSSCKLTLNFHLRNSQHSLLLTQASRTNDVYQVKGAVSHLNDVIILLPIFVSGQLVGWAANFGHLTDVQGSVPGTQSPHFPTPPSLFLPA